MAIEDPSGRVAVVTGAASGRRAEQAMEPPTFRERGFPYSTFPSGWFQVGWSGELAVGEVLPLRFFGTELVLFRTRSGEAAVLDGTCAHMGAAPAFGGAVEDECLRCPFHAWLWHRDGHLVQVPYSDGHRRRRCGRGRRGRCRVSSTYGTTTSAARRRGIHR